MKKTLFLLTFLLSAILLTGCLNQSSGNANDENSDRSAETFKWVTQSPYPKGTAVQKIGEQIAEDITKASGGRLEVEMYAADEIVSASELLDAVDQGTLDAGYNWDGYWVGKMPQISLFSTVPMGMTEHEYLGWIKTGGGLELWQQVYDEYDYNVKVLDAGAGTAPILFHSNKPIRTVDDFKGLKMRAAGEWAAIAEKLGASVVNIDAGELYQSLERGVVDAAGFGSPASNYPLGFHEITKYMVTPAIHQPTSAASFIVNQDKWDELPDDLKEVVTIASENMWGKGWTGLVKEDIEAMNEYRELVDQGKLEIIEFDVESQKVVKEVVDEYYKEKSEKDPLFKKIWESQQEYMNDFRYWRELMIPQY